MDKNRKELIKKLERKEPPTSTRVICGIIQQIYQAENWNDDMRDIIINTLYLSQSLGAKLIICYKKYHIGYVLGKTFKQEPHPNRRYEVNPYFTDELKNNTIDIMKTYSNTKCDNLLEHLVFIYNNTNNQAVKDICVEAVWMACKMETKIVTYEKENKGK